MKARRTSRKQMQSLCAALGPQDGDDPRYDACSAPERRSTRKARQLCAQVARTLHGIFSGECGDDLLSALTVTSVEPAPHAGRLLVTVSLAQPELASVVLERLQQAVGMLRAEVAATIHRRRAPELAFRIATRAEGDPSPK